jgi:hypothetical protein
MKENIIQGKSYAFALRIVNLYCWLCEERPHRRHDQHRHRRNDSHAAR